MKLATAPGTWGVEPLPHPDYPPWTRVLDEIAEAGFDGSELGPLGYLPTGAELRDALAARGLGMPAGFVMEPLSVASERARVLELTRATCAALADVGAETLVVIDALVPERSATAGRSEQAARLDEAGWTRLLEGVREVAGVAHEHGLRAAFHAHAGTWVEFEDEIDRLMAELPASELGLCADSGHAVYAGFDPVAHVERHAERIAHVHLKDLDAGLLRECTAQRLSFEQSVARGVFRPLGAGSVDLRAFAEALCGIGYDGWATFEQDRVVETIDDALPEARASVEHARAVGF